MGSAAVGQKIFALCAAPPFWYNVRRQRIKEQCMPAVMEAINRMSSEEKIKTMEYLWASMTAVAEPKPPAWHGDILSERRRRVAAGEEGFMSIAESKRRLYEEVHAR